MNPSGGFIKLFRSMKDHQIWTSERFSRGQAFADLLLLANWEDGRILRGDNWINVARGQVLTTQMHLAQRWKWNRKTVRRFLAVLERAQMVTIAAATARDNGYTLITILNYGKYQDSPVQDGATQGTAEGAANRASRGQRMGHYIRSKEEQEGEERKESPMRRKAPQESNAALFFFAEEFLEKRGVPYQHTKGDFVALANLRTAFNLESAQMPDSWERAIEHYLATPQSKYTLCDLCRRYDVFISGPLDRFGRSSNKPKMYTSLEDIVGESEQNPDGSYRL